MQVTRYKGPGSWTGAEWAVNIACILARLDGAPIHMTQRVSMDDVWNARRLRAKFPAFSRNLRISARSIRLPPASMNGLVYTLQGAGHMTLDGKRRGPVIVHMKYEDVTTPLVPCPYPLFHRDAYDLHLNLDVGLSAAFFGQRVLLGDITGVPALPDVHIPPFAQDPELRRVTIVNGAGLLIPDADADGESNIDYNNNDKDQQDKDKGNLVIFSRLRLPRIPQDVLLSHEPLIRGVFDKIESLNV